MFKIEKILSPKIKFLSRTTDHSPNTELGRSIEVTLQQNLASNRHLHDQISSNAANDTFYSADEKPYPHHQQLVPAIPHDATEIETSITEASSAIMLEDKSASQQPQAHIDCD